MFVCVVVFFALGATVQLAVLPCSRWLARHGSFVCYIWMLHLMCFCAFVCLPFRSRLFGPFIYSFPFIPLTRTQLWFRPWSYCIWIGNSMSTLVIICANWWRCHPVSPRVEMRLERPELLWKRVQALACFIGRNLRFTVSAVRHTVFVFVGSNF